MANARRCFFAIGAKGLFQGKLNPLSGKAILNACVILSCLSGCENWILNDVLLSSLEAFQGEIRCRILNLSKHHAHLVPLITLNEDKNPIPKSVLSIKNNLARK